MICVDCGREVDGLIGGSCPACFAAKNVLLSIPDVVGVEICAHCGARKIGAHWHEPAPDTPEEWVLEDALRAAASVHKDVDGPALDVDLTEKDQKTFEARVVLHGSASGVPVGESRNVLLRRTRSVCDRCSRIQGGYYAAIIQLRATDRDMTPAELEQAHGVVAADLDRQLGTGNRSAFLAKSTAIHGGYDYYIGDIEAGRNVARRLRERLGGTMSESAKLVGRREGEDVYRVTFLVRLAPFSPGDVVLREATPHLVLQVHPTGIASFDLERHHRGRIPIQGLKRMGGQEVVEEAVTVSRGPDGVLVVDPKTQRTETILVPEAAQVQETVPVVRVDERLYWAPPPRLANNL